MENLIKQILEMDRQAREETQQAQERRSAIEQSVQKERQKMHDEYIARAQKRIATLEKEEMEYAQKAALKAQEDAQKQAAHLDDLYQEKKEKWIEEIVSRVTRG